MISISLVVNGDFFSPAIAKITAIQQVNLPTSHCAAEYVIVSLMEWRRPLTIGASISEDREPTW